ncbi:MAG: response regulator [bacterium]
MTKKNLYNFGIIEDDPSMLAHLISQIQLEPRLQLMGQAETFSAGLSLINRRPDILFTDLGLPDGSGLEIIRKAKEKNISKVVVLSVMGDEKSVLQAIDNGADGYIMKYERPNRILEAIDSILQGGAAFSDSISRHLLNKIHTASPQQENSSASHAMLSRRELELLTLFAQGKSYAKSAEALGISPHTVAGLVKTIYRKLNVHSQSEAVAVAIKQGWIQL